MKRFLMLFTLLVAFGLGPVIQAQTDNTLKAGFIYVGPVGDYGWSYAHDIGRQIAELKLPWLESIIVESVPEAEVEPFIDQLVAEGAEVIFTTSFGYMDGTLAAAELYPDVIFAHATGFLRAPNVATYHADFYQIYYLNGMMAGALTESNKLGYVAAVPIPEVKRHINAFALGARAVNPEAEVHVRWIFEWFNPGAAKEATEALIAEGADVFAFTEDTPTVIQVAAEKGLPSFGHYSPMMHFAPEHVVSGQLVNWDVLYVDFLSKIHNGVYTAENLEDVDYFHLLADNAVELGGESGSPINPLFIDALQAVEVGESTAYDLIIEQHSQMQKSPVEFEPFTGPIQDRNGNELYAEGAVASLEELLTLEWAVEGVVGPWPNEPGVE